MGSERTVVAVDSSLRRFADRLREKIGAERVLLFGSYARGTATRDSDFDVMIVAEHFASIPPLEREYGLHDIFYEIVGVHPLDFMCLSPEEFEVARGSITLVAEVLPEAIDLLPVEARVS